MSDNGSDNGNKKSVEITKVPQPHGGALNSGGTPGNKGGRSYPLKAKAASALAYEERIPALASIADDDAERATDRIKAIDILGKHGGVGDKVGYDRVLVDRLGATTANVLHRECPELASDLLAKLSPAWRHELGAHTHGE